MGYPLPQRESRRPLKILVVANRVRYLNDVHRTWPLLFFGNNSVAVFGPGYVDASTLSKGLLAFARNHGPFDFIVSDHFLYRCAERVKPIAETAMAFKRNYAFTFDLEAAQRAWPQIARDFFKIDATRILLYTTFDSYNLKEDEFDWLVSSDAFILGWGTDLMPPPGESNRVNNERFARAVTTYWNTFVADYSHQVISFPGYVMPDLINWSPLSERKWEWSVPGANYTSRREAIAILRLAGIKPHGVALNSFVRVWNKIDPQSSGRDSFIRFARAWFNRVLANSRYVYTCGSGLSVPLEKFFEIPGAGAVLVCEPFNNAEAYGFIDGTNYLSRTPGNVAEAHQELVHDPLRAQDLAENGRSLVLRAHTLDARRSQLATVLHSMIEGSFKGAEWRAGQLRLI